MLPLVEVRGWSRSWLGSALSGHPNAKFVLHDDADVGILAGAAGTLRDGSWAVELCFGSGVSAGAVAGLASALAGKLQRFSVGDDSEVQGVVGGWEGALALTSEHVMALLPVVPTLTCLMLRNCSLVEDDALIAVCKAGGLLEELHVRGGAG